MVGRMNIKVAVGVSVGTLVKVGGTVEVSVGGAMSAVCVDAAPAV